VAFPANHKREPTAGFLPWHTKTKIGTKQQACRAAAQHDGHAFATASQLATGRDVAPGWLQPRECRYPPGTATPPALCALHASNQIGLPCPADTCFFMMTLSRKPFNICTAGMLRACRAPQVLAIGWQRRLHARRHALAATRLSEAGGALRHSRARDSASGNPADDYLMVGPAPQWSEHLARCRDMGFDCVAVPPLFAPDLSEDVFLTGDAGEFVGRAGSSAFGKLTPRCCREWRLKHA
jgi:hypothetical protein